MSRTRVLMLLQNAFGPDPRVFKEAKSLVRNGYLVTILAWDREAKYPKEESIEGVRIRRVRIRSGFGKRLGQVPYLFLMYLSFIAYGIRHSFDIVHCHDLDTLPAGAMVKILTFFRSKLIFDSHENFPVQKAYELPRFALPVMNGLQGACVRFVDLIFTASSVLQTEFEKRYKPGVVWLPNFAEREFFDVDKKTVDEIRSRLGFGENDLVLAYIGGLRPARAVVPLVKAVTKRPDVKLFICGAGEQAAEIRSLAAVAENVNYVGAIPQAEIIPYYFACDILYYGLVNYPGAVYNAPNNFSYGALAGKPMIGVDIGDLGRFLKESGCGIGIHEASESEIGRAIDELADSRSRLSELQALSRRLGNAEYHWGVVEQRLIGAYRQL